MLDFCKVHAVLLSMGAGVVGDCLLVLATVCHDFPCADDLQPKRKCDCCGSHDYIRPIGSEAPL